ncbi:hypothetical protein O181_058314 [Austropuccinia psidii MF-1]|uniref:Cell cycle checkpoint protein RAD1 n=1 Tax=Austropuccinia psidii MF-1 TaxID=1389203 RepID=A0A9Q3EC67_9BASI|nr:hypothetical protein [Austropuccinia psidii MF-1]
MRLGDGNDLFMSHHQDQIKNQVLCCYSPDLRPFAILLSTVNFSSRAIIQISSSGIHVEVEIGKTLQAHAYLEKSAFTDWEFNPPLADNRDKNQSQLENLQNEETEAENEEEEVEVKFEVSLTALIECLNVFGTATSQKSSKNFNQDHDHQNEKSHSKMWDDRLKSKKQPASAIRISYDGEGHPLVLLIEDSGVVTRCSLVTYEPDELAEMDFPVDRQVVHLIMKSDWLKSAFSQFDDKSGSEIAFMFSPPAKNAKHSSYQRLSSTNGTRIGIVHPTFRIEVDGDMGCWTTDFPNDKDILESFECKPPEGLDPEDIDRMSFIRNSYKLSHILKFKKALDVSSKASLRVDDTGFLSLQLLVRLEESPTMKTRTGYVEFLCVPLEDG